MAPPDPTLSAAAQRNARAAAREEAREQRASRLPWREEIERLVARDFGDGPEAARISELMSAALTESTAEGYSRNFVRFAEWCDAQPDRPCPLPATTSTVLRWLAGDVCSAGRVQAKSLQNYLSAINTIHERHIQLYFYSQSTRSTQTSSSLSLQSAVGSDASGVASRTRSRVGAARSARTCPPR